MKGVPLDVTACRQRRHRRFFQTEGQEQGYAFTEDMPVLFEDFQVIYRL